MQRDAEGVARRPGTSRHAETGAVTAGKQCTVLKRGEEVVPLKVRVVRENLVNRHPGREEFQKHLDRVPQPADRRLPMADLRISGDAVEASHDSRIPPEPIHEGQSQPGHPRSSAKGNGCVSGDPLTRPEESRGPWTWRSSSPRVDSSKM